MKKDKANVLIYPVLGMVLLLIFALIFLMIISAKTTNSMQNIENLSHKYLLEMEYSGGLSVEGYESFKSDLEKMGVTDISFEGTTRTDNPADYGEPAYLSISGTIETFNASLTSGIHSKKQFSIKKVIISKNDE